MKETENMENCFYETLKRAEQDKLTEEDKSFLKCAKIVLENIVYSTNKYKTIEEYRERCKQHLKKLNKYI